MALTITEDRISCPDCKRFIYRNGREHAIAHSKRCDLNEQPTVEQIHTAAAPAAPAKLSAAQLATHAKRGDLALYATHNEIVDAVKRGQISESDAMNQDF